MASSKKYKCGYSHCNHPDDLISAGDGTTVGKRHYHNDCFKQSETIKEIRGYYLNNISDTVVMSLLNKVINVIIFEKNVSAEYLLYCLKYAVANKIRINSPLGMYYLIDNKRIKEAHTANKACEIKKEIKVSCDDDFDFSAVQPKNNQYKHKSFADILRGDAVE